MDNQKGTALITGGSLRLGREITLALAKAGYDVVIHYHNSTEPAEKLADEIKALGVNAYTLQADLQNRDVVESLIANANKKAGPISLLVNNASVFMDDSITDFTPELMDAHMALHVYAPTRLTQKFVEQVNPELNNQVINIIDQRVYALTPRFFTYTMSKSALWAATKTMAQALGPQNIRVNAIGPGPTLRNHRQSEEDWQRQNSTTILGRGAKPSDICDCLLYLTQASAITGQMIAVDGGQHLAWETPDVLINE